MHPLPSRLDSGQSKSTTKKLSFMLALVGIAALLVVCRRESKLSRGRTTEFFD
jgi:hypothetical protein